MTTVPVQAAALALIGFASIGTSQGLETFGTETATVSAGETWGWIQTFDSSQVNLEGGLIFGTLNAPFPPSNSPIGLFMRQQSRVHQSGGDVGGITVVADSAEYTAVGGSQSFAVYVQDDASMTATGLSGSLVRVADTATFTAISGRVSSVENRPNPTPDIPSPDGPTVALVDVAFGSPPTAILASDTTHVVLANIADSSFSVFAPGFSELLIHCTHVSADFDGNPATSDTSIVLAPGNAISFTRESDLFIGSGTNISEFIEVEWQNGESSGIQFSLANWAGNLTFANTPPLEQNPPLIGTSPNSRAVDSGQPASLSVDAVGQGLVYEWRRDGVPLSASDRVTGQDGPTLHLLPAAQSDAGVYDVVVSNAGGTVTSAGAVFAVRETCPADQNSDGVLSPADYNAWILNYNMGCP